MSCKNCIYKAMPRAGYICDYALITGHSRGCDIKDCTVKKTSGRERRIKPRTIILSGTPSNRTAHKTREDKPGTPLRFDESKAKQLFFQEFTDRQIADALGNVVTRHGIRAWRYRRGLIRDVNRRKFK